MLRIKEKISRDQMGAWALCGFIITRSKISARAIQITLVTVQTDFTVVTFTLSHTKIHFTLTLCTCYA